MKDALSVLFACAFLACATTTPAPAPAPADVAPATLAASAVTEPAPCNPGLTILNAALWMQTAAEYRASALQTYAGARRALDQALSDPAWTGAWEEMEEHPEQPPAIILDLDETSLDNGGFEARAIHAGKTYDSKMWKQWTSEGIAKAVPGAAAFLEYAKSRGVTPFYITNRDKDEEPGTRRNLEQLGFPLDPAVDTLLMQGKNGWTTSDKSPRRGFVAGSYRVLLLLGDDLNDFTTASGKTAAERDEIINRTASWWGTRWFILPNAEYGSWESAAIGSGGSPCERMQRKLDVLKEQ
jgi:5'-nucleotidase (lipoprotein e(P4) family)